MTEKYCLATTPEKSIESVVYASVLVANGTMFSKLAYDVSLLEDSMRGREGGRYIYIPSGVESIDIGVATLPEVYRLRLSGGVLLQELVQQRVRRSPIRPAIHLRSPKQLLLFLSVVLGVVSVVM